MANAKRAFEPTLRLRRCTEPAEPVDLHPCSASMRGVRGGAAGPVQLGPVQLGPVQLGPVQLGPVAEPAIAAPKLAPAIGPTQKVACALPPLWGGRGTTA
jgi:hypothetical protein